MNRPAHNFYINNCVKCGASAHGSYSGTASAKMARPRGGASDLKKSLQNLKKLASLPST
jgi:hypothetical protein